MGALFIGWGGVCEANPLTENEIDYLALDKFKERGCVGGVAALKVAAHPTCYQSLNLLAGASPQKLNLSA